MVGALSEFKGEKRPPLGEKELLANRVHRVALTLEDADKPVIAAAHRARPSPPIGEVVVDHSPDPASRAAPHPGGARGGS
jgi:hypothetical protein